MKWLIAVSALLFFQSAFADISTSELLKACDEKTLVMEKVEGKTELVGEELDGYCRGYIEGVIATLRGKICLKGKDSHFVISVLRNYVKEQPLSGKQNAADSLSKALLRAYSCK